MNEEQQLKLQAFLDGELPEAEARDVAARLARDSEAAALVNELRNTRRALKALEPELPLPESREFYWSKIRREIERLDVPAPAAESASLFTWLRRLLIPAGAVAAVALAVLVATLRPGVLNPVGRPDTEIANADVSTFTYDDYASGTTLVWVDYPAER